MSGASIWSPGSTITIDSASLLALFQTRGGWCGSAGGTPDAIVLTPSTVLAAYAAGQQFSWISTGANTGAVTVNISGLGPKALTKEDTIALTAEDIPGVSVITATYDGTRLILMEVASVNKSVFTAAGDEIVATAAGVPARIPATADVAAHATTMNPWNSRNVVLTGGVVTFTALANAPYIGAVAWIKANAAHIWTNGATFRMPGLVNYTCAADDWIRIEAVTLSTFSVAIFKADGTAIVQPTIATTPSIRQTVRLAALDSSGYCALLSAGAGLNFNVAATTTPAVLDFAAGNTDYTSTLSANATNQGTLIASNTNYIHATYSSSITVTWSNCLIPPQYGYAFDRTENLLCRWTGIDGAVTTTEDFGNTITFVGNAQVDTAIQFVSCNSLLLDGTVDYAYMPFTSLGDGSWEITVWFRPTDVTDNYIYSLRNAADFGVAVFISAGSTLALYASSDGTTHNIANGTAGAAVLVAGTNYRVRTVFDALGGTYRVYLSVAGAAETQQISVASTARICSVSRFAWGGTYAGLSLFTGSIGATTVKRAASTNATATPSASAPVITEFPVHFFSIPEMKMYEATVASAAAGSNPTLTAVNRLFVGEQDTGAATVSATRNYAIRGDYLSDLFSHPLAGTLTIKNHNIGIVPKTVSAKAIVTTSGTGIVGEEFDIFLSDDSNTVPRGSTPLKSTRNSMTFKVATMGSAIFATGGSAWIPNNASGTFSVRLYAKRGW